MKSKEKGYFSIKDVYGQEQNSLISKYSNYYKKVYKTPQEIAYNNSLIDIKKRFIKDIGIFMLGTPFCKRITSNPKTKINSIITDYQNRFYDPAIMDYFSCVASMNIFVQYPYPYT